MHKDDQIRAKKNIETLISGEKIGINEYTLIRKDGTSFPILTNSNITYKNNNFSSLRIIAVDITDKKRPKKKYREVKENTGSFLKVPLMVYIGLL